MNGSGFSKRTELTWIWSYWISSEHGIINKDTRNCGRTTDDRRRTKGNHKSSPCHYVTGELKRRKSSFWGKEISSFATMFSNVVCKEQKKKLLSFPVPTYNKSTAETTFKNITGKTLKISECKYLYWKDMEHLLWAISPFATMFSKFICCSRIKMYLQI